MRLKDNERGSALLMVLMLVIVFTVLGMALMSLNGSASKQFNKKEEQVQARHQAEMGVLHYQNQLRQMIKSHNLKLEDIVNKNTENIAGLIEFENGKFCDGLDISVAKPEDPNNAENANYETSGSHTGCGESGEVIVTVDSEGWAGKNGLALISAKLTLNMPDNSHIPDPDPDNVETTWPCNNSKCEKTIEDYTVVEDVEIKEGKLQFNNHLVVNSLSIEPGGGNVENGKGASITVAKDLYIKSLLNIHNQGCIAVQGKFTVSNEMTFNSNGHIYIFVYGDAYLPSIPKFGKIYINGNLYIGGEKKDKKEYNNVYDSVPENHSTCTLPSPIENSNPSVPEINKWNYDGKIKADYL